VSGEKAAADALARLGAEGRRRHWLRATGLPPPDERPPATGRDDDREPRRAGGLTAGMAPEHADAFLELWRAFRAFARRHRPGGLPAPLEDTSALQAVLISAMEEDR
jgi:hypothetical protein